jgi:hypothetical protein
VVASSPLSDTLHSNSTSSSSPRLRNPDIWITLWKNNQHHRIKHLTFYSRSVTRIQAFKIASKWATFKV